MIDYSRAQLKQLSIHYVGNKGLGEELSHSKNAITIQDDFVKDTLMRYFFSSFKTDIYYQFKGKVDVSLRSVSNICEDLFKNQNQFLEQAQQAALHLYNQSVHPKIKGGELYVCYFADVMVDGELLDAIGFFKTENKETYLKIFQHLDDFNVECEAGINIHKLDKGCLVFNTDKKSAYKLSVIDANNRVAECANYWQEDFLNAQLKPSPFYHTKNFIDASRGFCEEILTEQNNVEKFDQQKMLNKSTAYFKDKTDFTLQNFETEVLEQPEIIEAFKDYRKDFNKKLNLTAIDDFEISPTAVKQNTKYMRSVVKLDKNFHVYIHAKHEFVERGFDDEKNLKYYKLFYINEE